MHSFQQVVVFLFALVAFAFAQGSLVYDETVYVTSTIYKVNTVTLSGTPTASLGNTTTTIKATAYASPAYSVPGNGSAPYPTGTGSPSSVPSPKPSQFPGAASGLSSNFALVAALAVGLGCLAL